MRFARKSSDIDPLPLAREVTVDGPAVRLPAAEVLVGLEPASPAWHELSELDPRSLPAEGYALRIGEHRGRARVVIAAADDAGERFARVALDELVAGDQSTVPQLSVRDWPELPVRGVIEGFYGTPWSDVDRESFFPFAARNRLNTYVYAPKDDPLHRERWRELYDEAGLAKLARLVRAAAESGIRFVYAIHPATSMRYTDESDHAALVNRAEQLWSIGVRSFALLFDDVPYELDGEDAARFEGSGAAHGDACARFVRTFLDGRPAAQPLVMVPTDYAGNQRSTYRTQLTERLPPNVSVWWTGSDVVVGEVTRADIDEAAEAFGRPLLLWDNYPVNDFDFSRLFLGPLQGRTTDLVDAPLLGITANPMVEATASRFALASMAEWAWNPGRYRPEASAARALAQVAGPELAAFVAAQSSWPPSAPQSDRWAGLLDERSPELLELCAQFEEMPVPGGRLGEELGPWLAAARTVAAGVRAALDPASPAVELERLRDAVAATPANVLRQPVVAFLERAIANRA